MLDFLFPFLLGAFCGSRTMLPTGVLCWFAFTGRLHAGGTWFAFLANPLTVAIFTTAVIAELIVDKLPITPSRLKAPLLVARLCAGAFVGAVLATAIGSRDVSSAVGAGLGASGAVFGALIGYWLRTRLVMRLRVPDWVVAVVEDATAILGSYMVVGIVTAALSH